MSQFYFAYGSNMKRSRLENRIGEVIDHGIASKQDYRIAFNKQSTDGTGKTNIVTPAGQEQVMGVLYELTEDQLKKLDGIEKGYVRIPIIVDWKAETKEVQTYVAIDPMINNDLLPKADYLQFLIDGASEHSFPEEYQELLKGFEVVNET